MTEYEHFFCFGYELAVISHLQLNSPQYDILKVSFVLIFC